MTQRGRSGAGAYRPAAPFARRSTRRLAILFGVVVLLAVMLVPTLRAYLRQGQEYDALQEKVVQQEKSIKDLDGRIARWDEPGYVEQQARERLKFVKPGEKAYSVIGADKLLGDPLQGRGTVVTPGRGDDQIPWYGRMWSSVVIADRVDADPRTAPVSPVGPRPLQPDGTTGPTGSSSARPSGASNDSMPPTSDRAPQGVTP